MARPPPPTTRESSADSSALSNILVATADDSASEHQAPASTPPTSLADTSSVGSAAVSAAGRARRARAKVDYNLKALSDAQLPVTTAATSRNVSGLTGRTLVQGAEDEEVEGTPFGEKLERALEGEWEIPDELPPRPVERKGSVRERVKKVAGKVGSVLGKRSREVMEAGKRTAEELGKKGKKDRKERWEVELDTGVKGVLDGLDFDKLEQESSDEEEEEEEMRPSKKSKQEGKKSARDVAPPLPAAAASGASGVVTGRKGKKWQKEGLFAGQSCEPDGTQPGKKKLQKKRPESSASDAPSDLTARPPPKRTYMPLPMFSYLDTTRDFIIPFDVFAPSVRKGDERPKDWHQINKNRIVGDAKDIWKKKQQKMAPSLCVCTPTDNGEPACDEGCLNRSMQYECNEDNCLLHPSECGNRSFAELAARMKKAGPYDIGVEVLKTAERGFGVRACRTFAPGEIVMEYTGELISETECQRRMVELYSNKPNYYLMDFTDGLVIDGTKGSMARFVNHSCEPNCEVRMMLVNGTPRMGVFAGDDGVMTGEELTYDYNFDNFGSTRQACYCGAPSCRGSLCAKMTASEMKEWRREEALRQRKAAEEAERNAKAMAKAKEQKREKGSGWRGWVTVGEVKEQLMREKALKEAAEKNSSRAQRLAARKSLGGAAATKSTSSMGENIKLSDSAKRRKTSGSTTKSTIRKVSIEPANRPTSAGAATTFTTIEQSTTAASAPDDVLAPTARPIHKPTHSALSRAGSRFTEALSRFSSSATETAKPSLSIEEELEQPLPASPVEEVLCVSEPAQTLDGVADEEKEEEEAAVPPAKKRRIGALIKGVTGAVKSSLAGGGRIAAEKGSGKMRQSTLNFAKVN